MKSEYMVTFVRHDRRHKCQGCGAVLRCGTWARWKRERDKDEAIERAVACELCNDKLHKQGVKERRRHGWPEV